MALKGQFDPWAIPDDFTVYKGAPEWLRPLATPCASSLANAKGRASILELFLRPLFTFRRYLIDL